MSEPPSLAGFYESRAAKESRLRDLTAEEAARTAEQQRELEMLPGELRRAEYLLRRAKRRLGQEIVLRHRLEAELRLLKAKENK